MISLRGIRSYQIGNGLSTKQYQYCVVADKENLLPITLLLTFRKHVSLLGLDCSGMRNGAEHNVMDQHCADHGVFVVENMINLDQRDRSYSPTAAKDHSGDPQQTRLCEDLCAR